MKIPSKVKIGGHMFDVEYVSEAQTGYDKAGTKFGWDGKIRLQADMMQSKKEVTLFHEILHEVDYQYNLDLSEKHFDALAESLYLILKDNDWLK